MDNKKIKKFYIFLFIFIIIFMFGIKLLEKREQFNVINDKSIEWNSGYCVDDGTRLIYESCGSKYHYSCPKCNKEFVFDEIQTYYNK